MRHTGISLAIGFVCAAGLIAPPRVLVAQQSSGVASVTGTVFDSIRNRPLAFARISVEGTPIVGVATADGHFQLDSVPAGKHRLVAAHPLLDTLGVRLVSDTITFVAGQTVATQLATPSSEHLVRMLCASVPLAAMGHAALFGRVYDADTHLPVTHATVSLVWAELDATGLRKVPRERKGPVGEDGVYRICGLPTTLDGNVQVIIPGVSTGAVPVVFQGETLRLRSLSVESGEAAPTPAPVSASTNQAATPPVAANAVAAASPPPPAPPANVANSVANAGAHASVDTASSLPQPIVPRFRIGRAKLTGRVIDDAAKPVAGARVQLDGTTRSATSRDDGTFALDSLPAGSQLVTVRAIGYTPTDQIVELSSTQPQVATIPLSKFVPTLTPIVTDVKRELDVVGYNDRKKSHFGTFYLDGDDIVKRQARVFSEFLRGATGVRVDPGPDGSGVLLDARNPYTGCVNILIDGSPFTMTSGSDIDNYLAPNQVGAIEVYSGANTPEEFQAPGKSSCVTIMVWTKFKLDQRAKAQKKNGG